MILLLALLLFAWPAYADETKVAWIGVQWVVPQARDFAVDCGSQNHGGHSCIFFPNGATITGINIQASLKSGSGIALFHLVTSDPGWRMIDTSLVGIPAAHVVKDMPLAHPVVIKPGGYVYVTADGMGE
jgi:hypothetical protein